jgi:hypothetical protein
MLGRMGLSEIAPLRAKRSALLWRRMESEFFITGENCTFHSAMASENRVAEANSGEVGQGGFPVNRPDVQQEQNNCVLCFWLVGLRETTSTAFVTMLL